MYRTTQHYVCMWSTFITLSPKKYNWVALMYPSPTLRQSGVCLMYGDTSTWLGPVPQTSKKKPVFLFFVVSLCIGRAERVFAMYNCQEEFLPQPTTIIFHKCRCGVTRIFHIWRKRQIYLLYTQIFHLLMEILVIQNDAMILCNWNELSTSIM